MLKFPKIQKDPQPQQIQYKEVVVSKLNTKSKKPKNKDSKFDWMGCQTNIIHNIQSQQILKQLIIFQSICRQRHVQQFYSYFFLKSLLLNKQISNLKDTNNQQGQQRVKQTTNNSDGLSKFILQSLVVECTKIESEVSYFNKIQSYILMRQDLLRRIQQNSKLHSHNSMYQNISDIQFLNLEVIDLIKTWKLELYSLQGKNCDKTDSSVDQIRTIEPIFYYQEQNYISKMIYDNADLISLMNLKRQINLISPPNPFFLSQDGNWQAMSQSQKDKIEDAMQFLAKQKAYQLKLILEQPQYYVKGKNSKDRNKSSTEINNQYYKRPKQNQKFYGSLSNSLLNTKNSPNRQQSIGENIFKNSNDKIMSAYHIKTSRVRHSAAKVYENRSSFQVLIKQKQISLLRQMRDKKGPPKQNLPNIKIDSQKSSYKSVSKSPYKERISILRKQVQKNIACIKQSKKQMPQIQQSLVCLNKSQKLLQNPQLKVNFPKPKIRLIKSRQVSVQKDQDAVNLFAQKGQSQVRGYTDKQQVHKGFQTFFKTPGQRPMQHSYSRLSPVKNTYLPPVTLDTNIRSRATSQIKHFTSSLNLLYKPTKLPAQINNTLGPRDSIVKQQPCNDQSYRVSFSNNLTGRNQIGVQQKNQKGKIRQIQIMRIYGKKADFSHKIISQSRVAKIKQQVTSQRSLSKSPYQKQTSDFKKNRSTIPKKQAVVLEYKIESLLNQQEVIRDRLINGTQIKQQNEAIYNELKRINLPDQFFATDQIKQNSNLTQKKSVIAKNLMKLQKKRQFIQQSNQLKKRQIQSNRKNKQKAVSQLQLRAQRLKQIQQKIIRIKNDRKSNLRQSGHKFKQSILIQKKSQISQQKPIIQKLKVQQQDLKKKNQILYLQMLREQEKFIKLKQEEQRMRQQMNKKKYLDSLQEMQSKYLQKQKQYEKKIVQEYRKRKENQISLMREKREAEQLKKKLYEQQMKQYLLNQILQKQKQKQNRYQKQVDQYQSQMRRKTQFQIRQIQEYQKKVAQDYQQQNQRMLTMMSELKQKNRRIQQSNKKRMEQVQQATREKQQGRRLLQQLQQEVMRIQQSRAQARENQDNQDALNSNQKSQAQEEKYLNQKQLQSLKYKLKNEILQEIISRNKKQELEQIKFEQQKRQRIQVFENQIKQYLKKQDQITRKIQQPNYFDSQRILSSESSHLNNQQLTNQNNQTYQIQEHKVNKLQSNDYNQQSDQKGINNLKERMDKKGQNDLIDSGIEQKSYKIEQTLQQIVERNDKKPESNEVSIQNNKSKIQNTKDSDIKKQIEHNKIKPNQLSNNQEGSSLNLNKANQVATQKDVTQSLYQKQTNGLIPTNDTPKDKQNIIQIALTKQVSHKQVKEQTKEHAIQPEQKDKLHIQNQQLKAQYKNKVIKSQGVGFQTIKQTRLQEKTSQEKVRLAVKQTNQQILLKYQALKAHLNMKGKIILIQESQINHFISQFYKTYPHQVRQMLPYNKQQLQMIMRNHKSLNRKIDLFDCHSIGWYDKQSRKYTLMGAIQCIHLIGLKYGSVQIQLVYIFNKSNYYQKQYLAKQIKVFQKIGYVYQKKMKQQNLYSIKLIIKIPKEIVTKDFQVPSQSLKFTMSIRLRSVSVKRQTKPEQRHRNVLWYLLGECLLSSLQAAQLRSYQQNCNHSIDMNLFIEKMKNSLPTARKQMSAYISHEQQLSSELQVSLKFPYIQLGPQIYLSLTAGEYILSTGQKAYLSVNSAVSGIKSMWRVLVMQIEKSQIQRNFIQVYLQSKVKQINQSKAHRQLGLLLPAFKIQSAFSSSEKEDFLQPFTFRSTINSSLISSSISTSNSLLAQSSKMITLEKNNINHGFAICVCYCYDQKIQRLVSGSWVGYQDLLK